jgi:hypothetical protein
VSGYRKIFAKTTILHPCSTDYTDFSSGLALERPKRFFAEFTLEPELRSFASLRMTKGEGFRMTVSGGLRMTESEGLRMAAREVSKVPRFRDL